MTSTPKQGNLFNPQTNVIQLPDAELVYLDRFLESDEAWTIYHALLEHTSWKQDELTVYGKTYLAPRLTCWVADEGLQYGYSQHTLVPHPWTPLLSDLKTRVERLSQHRFNSVLINHYRDGNDSNGWHADDEPELGNNPVIASLSLGAVRDFHLRHKHEKSLKHKMRLKHGSLLVMQGKTQACWQHHVPKRAHAESRINLTFRRILRT